MPRTDLSEADNEFEEFIFPQEHGNHIGVRLLEFKNGLSFVSDAPFECNFSGYFYKSIYKGNAHK